MSQFVPRLWSKLQQTRIPGCAAQVKYSNGVAPFFRELNDSKLPTMPLYAKIVETLSTMPQDTLRWHVTTDPSRKQLPKKVLRSFLTRRWNCAFLRALQDKGYTREGRQCETGRKGIVGTLELAIYGGTGFDTKMIDLVRQCKAVVTHIESRKPVRR